MPTLHKVILIGDASVGKTSLCVALKEKQFDPTARLATLGVDFFAYEMIMPDRTVNLQVWDTAGQERFGALIATFIRSASVVIFVYDITCRRSMTHIQFWNEKVRLEHG